MQFGTENWQDDEETIHRILENVTLNGLLPMLGGTLPALFRPEAPAKVSQRTLTFAEHVAYQRAIEEVYWRHRIWPKQRPDPKPSLDAVISQPPCSNWIVQVDRLLGEHGLERA